jgi:hypothetical protein
VVAQGKFKSAALNPNEYSIARNLAAADAFLALHDLKLRPRDCGKCGKSRGLT